MRTLISRALLVLAITSVAALAADNSIGTWKVNMAKSTYSPAPMPLKSFTAVREAVPGGVKVTMTGERTDGKPINATYTAKYDGSPVGVDGTGTPYDTIALKQVNANTFTADAKQKEGKYHATFRTVVSRDGKTMTNTGKGTDADGAPLAIKLVYEKQ